MTVGTVSYAAPEQLMGNTVDGRADQYALAATAYELLTGRPPFQNSNPAVVISQHLSALPPAIGDHRPELAHLDPVFAKALAKDPADRFDRCADFARALGHQLEGDTLGLTQAAAASAPAVRAGRSPALIAVVAVLAVLLCVAVAAAVFELNRADDERPTAAPTPSSTGRSAAPGTTSTAPPTTTTAPTATSGTPAPATPPVVVGADCLPEGSTAVTAAGATAYCSSIQDTDATVWSLTPGTVPIPTVTTDPTEEPLPAAEEPPVRVCMQQTGQTRRDCREQIRRSNGLP
jgi:serine/threonine-protein kinase